MKDRRLEGDQGAIWSIQERVHVEAEEAGFSRLRTVGYGTFHLILEEQDSLVRD